MDLWQAMSVGLVGFCIGLVLVALARLPDSRVIRPLFCLIICSSSLCMQVKTPVMFMAMSRSHSSRGVS